MMTLAIGIVAVAATVLVLFEGFYVAVNKERRDQFAADARTFILFLANLPMRTYTTWQLKAIRPNNYRGRHRRRSRVKIRFSWPWTPVAQ